MELEKFADEFGPEFVLEVYDSKIGMKGILVIDNSSRGPGKGGIRMTPAVDVEEVFRLARTMTWKTALAYLPFGGAKAGIISKPGMTEKEKRAFIESFAKALRPVCPSKYISAPDVNTGEREMEWFVKANGSKKAATGKPKKLGGIPHELGSTGFGVAHAAVVALRHLGLSVKDSSVAIEGFGNVGIPTAEYLYKWGARVVAVSDSKGVIYNKNGLDFKELSKIKSKTGSVVNYKPGDVLPNKDIFELPVDVLIPSALADSINTNNMNDIKAKIIVEGANIPMTPEIEEVLHKRNVLVVPDFAANAGGVISSYVEYIGKKPEYMFKLVEDKIKKNVKLVLDESEKRNVKPRDAALSIAIDRVRKASKRRD